MSDHLHCGVCGEGYTAGARLPKFLKCSGGLQHTFCLACLQQLAVADMVQCPSCGDLTSVGGPGGAADLADNIYLMPQVRAEAAAARLRGEEQFCRTCVSVAGDDCAQHELLPISEARDALSALGLSVSEQMEQVRHNRSVPLRLYRATHAVLMSAADAVRRALDDFDLDVQLDTDVLQEVERSREAVQDMPAAQLPRAFQLLTAQVGPTESSVRETQRVARQCEALLDSGAECSILNGVIKAGFPIGEWLQDGNLTKALMAATMVYFSLDEDTQASELSSERTGSGDKLASPGKGGKAATNAYHAPEAAANVFSCSDAKSAKALSANNGSVVKGGKKESKPETAEGKSNGTGSKTTSKSSGASALKPTTLTNGSVRNAKTAVVTPTKNGIPGAAAISHTPGKSSGTTSAKAAAASSAKTAPKPAATVAPTAAKALSFSTAVKKAGSVPAPSAATQTVERPVRGDHPRYCLEISVGNVRHRVVIELRTDMAPVMCDNFMLLCDGGYFDNTNFHFASAGDHLVGGKIEGGEGFAPLAPDGEKYVRADLCPLADECGAVRMKCMETVDEDGKKRGKVGSQFMVWVSDTRDYHPYQYTLVFGFIRQGLDVMRNISNMDRPSLRRTVRIRSARKHEQ